MKTLLFAGFLWALGLAVTFADMGDTYKTSCGRFGSPSYVNKSRSAVEVFWMIQNLTIGETFDGKNGQCDAVRYMSRGEFNPSDIRSWLATNFLSGDGYREVWQTTGRMWTNRSGSESAYLSVQVGQDGKSYAEFSIYSALARGRLHSDRLKEGDENAQDSGAPSIDTFPAI